MKNPTNPARTATAAGYRTNYPGWPPAVPRSVSARPMRTGRPGGPGRPGRPGGTSASAARHDDTLARDDAVAWVAHELRNFLAPVQYNLAVLQEGGTVAGHDAQVLARLHDQVGHLGRLVDDLLDLSRLQQGKLRLLSGAVELSEVAEQGIEVGAVQLRAQRHTLSRSLAPGVRVQGDAVRLAQAVGNLVLNAARYTPAGGQVAVVTRRDGPDGVIEVHDSGVGLDAASRSALFELYHQAGDGSRGGLGIGLNVARRIVELHGGCIEAESPGLGQGSTFRIRLPLLDSAS